MTRPAGIVHLVHVTEPLTVPAASVPRAEVQGLTGRGGDMPTGTYYWTLEAEDSYRKEKVQESGSVTLIR